MIENNVLVKDFNKQIITLPTLETLEKETKLESLSSLKQKSSDRVKSHYKNKSLEFENKGKVVYRDRRIKKFEVSVEIIDETGHKTEREESDYYVVPIKEINSGGIEERARQYERTQGKGVKEIRRNSYIDSGVQKGW